MSVDQSLLTSSPTFKTLEEVDSRKLPGRLRDGIARLATPYL